MKREEAVGGYLHVERNADKVVMDAGDQDVLLFVRRKFEQALSQIIAEAVDHKLCKVRINLGKNHVPMLGIALLKLSLKKATSMLIFTEARHIALQIFEP